MPNPSINRTCAKGRAGRLFPRWEDTLMPTHVTTPMADWDEVPSAFLERTAKVVVQRAPLSGTTP